MNGTPPRPIRVCRWSAGPCESSRTARASSANSGASSTSPTPAPARSSADFSASCVPAPRRGCHVQQVQSGGARQPQPSQRHLGQPGGHREGQARVLHGPRQPAQPLTGEGGARRDQHRLGAVPAGGGQHEGAVVARFDGQPVAAGCAAPQLTGAQRHRPGHHIGVIGAGGELRDDVVDGPCFADDQSPSHGLRGPVPQRQVAVCQGAARPRQHGHRCQCQQGDAGGGGSRRWRRAGRRAGRAGSASRAAWTAGRVIRPGSAGCTAGGRPGRPASPPRPWRRPAPGAGARRRRR